MFDEDNTKGINYLLIKPAEIEQIYIKYPISHIYTQKISSRATSKNTQISTLSSSSRMEEDHKVRSLDNKTEININFVRLTPPLHNFKIAAAKLSPSTMPEKKHRISFDNKKKPSTSESKLSVAVEEPPTPSNKSVVSATTSTRSNIMSAAKDDKETETEVEEDNNTSIDLEASSEESEEEEKELFDKLFQKTLSLTPSKMTPKRKGKSRKKSVGDNQSMPMNLPFM